jgi:WD40 repeat protein
LLRYRDGYRLWDRKTAEPVATIQQEAGGYVAPSRDWKYLLSHETKRARVWDAVTGQFRCEVPAQPAEFRNAETTPDGTRLVTAGRDKNVRFWDLNSGKEVGPVLRHLHEVGSLVFSPDGRRLLTAGGADIFQAGGLPDSRALGEARVWGTDTGEPIAYLPHREWVNGA